MEPDLTSLVEPPGLMATLPETKNTNLQCLVHLAGPALSDHQAVGCVLSLCCTDWQINFSSCNWLTSGEKGLLFCSLNQQQSRTQRTFPSNTQHNTQLNSINKKNLNKACVQVLNEKSLNEKNSMHLEWPTGWCYTSLEGPFQVTTEKKNRRFIAADPPWCGEGFSYIFKYISYLFVSS